MASLPASTLEKSRMSLMTSAAPPRSANRVGVLPLLRGQFRVAAGRPVMPITRSPRADPRGFMWREFGLMAGFRLFLGRMQFTIRLPRRWYCVIAIQASTKMAVSPTPASARNPNCRYHTGHGELERLAAGSIWPLRSHGAHLETVLSRQAGDERGQTAGLERRPGPPSRR